jgi:hypothetical protein
MAVLPTIIVWRIVIVNTVVAIPDQVSDNQIVAGADTSIVVIETDPLSSLP